MSSGKRCINGAACQSPLADPIFINYICKIGVMPFYATSTLFHFHSFSLMCLDCCNKCPHRSVQMPGMIVS